jgi:monofunctional biosynthetic peptidoglycan transglycosylase
LTVLLVLPWRWVDPPTSAFVLRAGSDLNRPRIEWVDLAEISPNLPIAVVAAEDQNFPHHHGFDLDSIEKAVRERDQRFRGASTISQQVAKNLFLWPGRSWVRKGLEAYLTLFVETLWPKQRILEIYLNVAQFGPATFGVGASADELFDRPASELSLRQSALMASVLPSPERMSALEPSPYVEKRVAWIMNQVDQLGGPAYLEGM